MLPRILPSAAVTLALAVAAAPAWAQDLDDMTIFGRSLSVSVTGGVKPDYMGSDRYTFGPGGTISLDAPGERAFSAPDDGLSLAVLGGDAFSLGLNGRYRSGRGDHHDLRGFDELDWSVEAGAFAQLWATDALRLRVAGRRGFNGHKAWVADVGADLVHRGGPWVLSAGPRFTWASKKFSRAYFGVSPVDAARSPFAIAPYAPDDAFTSAGAIASAEYRLNKRWSAIADAEYRRIMGDAADSPIVDPLGSADQFRANIGVRYSFGR